MADDSWVYAWVDTSGQVLYVGATGLPVEVRTWLHVTSEDPQIGRILAHHREALVGRVDVRAWRLPPGADRQLVRALLSAELMGASDGTPGSMDAASAAAIEEILVALRR